MTIIDIYIEQGVTLSQVITLNTDITGSTIRGSVNDSDGTNYPNLATITDALTGEITLSLASTITADMNYGVGYYGVELIATDTTVSRPIKGRAYIEKEITI